MTSDTSKPLLMVDIDGVISLFGVPATPAWRGRRSQRTAGAAAQGASTRSTACRTSFRPPPPRTCSSWPSDFDLVWASGWEERAEEHLPRLLGLPAGLPFLRFERSPGARANAHWKLAAIDAYAGHAPAGVDRRRLQRRLPRVGRRSARRRRCSCSTEPARRAHVAGGAAAGGVGAGALARRDATPPPRQRAAAPTPPPARPRGARAERPQPDALARAPRRDASPAADHSPAGAGHAPAASVCSRTTSPFADTLRAWISTGAPAIGVPSRSVRRPSSSGRGAASTARARPRSAPRPRRRRRSARASPAPGARPAGARRGGSPGSSP